MRKAIAGLALALATLGAWALPTLQQVEDEVRLGHLGNAESMMREVVAARPESARAHYVYAEILARNGRFAEATEQAHMARQADPKIGFTEPEKFQAFERLLERERQATARSAQGTAPAALGGGAGSSNEALRAVPGVPGWIWIAGLALLAVVAWRGFARSRAQAASPAGAGWPTASAAGSSTAPGAPSVGPYGPAGGASPYAPPGAASARSGMLGTGLAAAGGFAAGMLADELLNRRHDAPSGALDGLGPRSFAPLDGDPAATELESRPVDFGTGPDWDAGSAADAGSFDAGGGGGDDWS
jgi:hypothetical protein